MARTRNRKPPATATKLWLWMHEWGVKLEKLAELVKVNAAYLGQIRRGVARPSDELKKRIQAETRGFEEAKGVAEPKGVAILDWF